jgi:hypothetical protein
MADQETIESFVRQANIERYQRLLRTVHDQQQREVLSMLLWREENKASRSLLDSTEPQGVANTI